MPREMLKLRKGDTAIMIKGDGSIEMAGLQGKELINAKGHISPCILFAAAWAKKDEKLLVHLVLTTFSFSSWELGFSSWDSGFSSGRFSSCLI